MYPDKLNKEEQEKFNDVMGNFCALVIILTVSGIGDSMIDFKGYINLFNIGLGILHRPLKGRMKKLIARK